MKYLKLFEDKQSSEFATANDYKSLLKISSTICNVENGEYEGVVDRMMDRNHITNSYKTTKSVDIDSAKEELLDFAKRKDINLTVNCDCGWSWKIEKGDKNPYLCHKCNNIASKSVNESNESMYSMASLTDLRDSIEFISKYDNMELYEAIDVINKLLDMDLNDAKEWRESLVTNYRKSDLDNFTIELIDKYILHQRNFM